MPGQGSLGGVMGRGGGMPDIVGQMAGQARSDAQLRRQAGEERRALAQAHAASAGEASFGLDTAARAKLLRDADNDARRAFGQQQSELARTLAVAREERNARVQAEARVQAASAAFGRATSERARLLREADAEARQAFGARQAELARAHAAAQAALAGTVDASARVEGAVFGKATADRARALRDADIAARRAFGQMQAEQARLLASIEADRQARLSANAQVAAAAEFGERTAARARLQREAEADTRRAFGAQQAELARARASARAAASVQARADTRLGTLAQFGLGTSADARLLGQSARDGEAGRTFGAEQATRARARAGQRED